MGKSGLVIGAELRAACGISGEKEAETGEAVLPAPFAGRAQVGQVLGPVMGVWVGGARGGAEEVEVDAVHGLRP
jgi:hypothetical protein